MRTMRFSIALSFCLVSFLYLRSSAVAEIIPAGTLLQCTLDESNFSSKTALVGDPVLCHLGSIGSFGHAAFPRGSMLGGYFKDYKNPGHFAGKGWLELEFDRLIVPGEVVPISAKVIGAPHAKVDTHGDIYGKGHPKRDAIEWMIPVLWPLKAVTLPERGPYPTLRGETRITLRLMDDVDLPSTGAQMHQTAALPAPYGSISRAANLIQPARYVERLQTDSQFALARQAKPPLTVIALRCGDALLVHQYWLEGGKFRYISMDNESRTLTLSRIDLTETVLINQQRKVEFVLQGRNDIEQ